MSTPTRVLILRAGRALDTVRERFGDYDQFLVRAIEAKHPSRFQFDVIEPFSGGPLPTPKDYAGVIISGSSASMTAPEPWMDELGGWVMGAASLKIPVLGICFGHQLLADAFGGKVEAHRHGREAGTQRVELMPEARTDPLFAMLPDTLLVQEAHSDVVVIPPPGSQVLATGAGGTIQALRIGPCVYGVQFHPEFSAEVCGAYVEARAARVRASGVLRGVDPEAHLAAVLNSVEPSDHGTRLLANWAQGLRGSPRQDSRQD